MFLFAALLFCSCSKKLQNCTGANYRIPVGIAFEGNDTADLKTVIVYYFAPNDSFLTIERADTEADNTIYALSGYLYDSAAGVRL